MEDENFLTDDFLRQLINVGEVDILVGLPTHNNAKTIGSIVHTIRSGILRDFPRERAVIINADGGSRDGTPELITGVSIDDVRPASNLYALRTLHAISTKYASTPAEWSCVADDSGSCRTAPSQGVYRGLSRIRNLSTPEWISNLLRPVYYEGFDLVSPTYRRHKFDGLIDDEPAVSDDSRALRRKDPRSPHAGVRILRPSGKPIPWPEWLERWKSVKTGLELRFTLAAITGGFRICQSFLGDEGSLSNAAPQTLCRRCGKPWRFVFRIGVRLRRMERSVWFPADSYHGAVMARSYSWIRCGSIGSACARCLRTELPNWNPSFSRFSLLPLWPNCSRSPAWTKSEFRYPAELWVKTVYEFAAAYQKSVINRDHIIQALAPLFRGRVFTFLVENRNGSAKDVANNIESLCLEFERLKPYLLEIWKSKE